MTHATHNNSQLQQKIGGSVPSSTNSLIPEKTLTEIGHSMTVSSIAEHTLIDPRHSMQWKINSVEDESLSQ